MRRSPMRPRSVALIPLCAILALPATLHAQLSSSTAISIGDVARGIAIGRTVLAVLHRASPRSGPSGSDRGSTSSGRATTTSRGGSGASARSASRAARAVLASGDQFLGVPYKWGGSTPAGFDCSGFVQYIFREHGVELPRTSRQMAHAGRAVATRISALQPGDLMLFSGKDGVIDHVAVYAGDDRILHSSSSGRGVRYDDLDTQRGAYFRTHFAAARRVLEDGRSLVEPLSLIERAIPFDHFDPADGAPLAVNPWAKH